MPDASDPFLAQGLRHYPDAHATVEQFQRQVRERIMARLRARAWQAWIPTLDDLATTQSTRNGLWLGAGCAGRVKGFAETVNIDAGLWWGRAGRTGPCEVGLSAWNSPEWLRGVWRVPEPSARRGVRAERKYLFVALREDETDFERVLDDVLEAFDACAAAAQR